MKMSSKYTANECNRNTQDRLNLYEEHVPLCQSALSFCSSPLSCTRGLPQLVPRLGPSHAQHVNIVLCLHACVQRSWRKEHSLRGAKRRISLPCFTTLSVGWPSKHRRLRCCLGTLFLSLSLTKHNCVGVEGAVIIQVALDEAEQRWRNHEQNAIRIYAWDERKRRRALANTNNEVHKGKHSAPNRK